MLIEMFFKKKRKKYERYHSFYRVGAQQKDSRLQARKRCLPDTKSASPFLLDFHPPEL
jgi:hypothetical protein